MRCHVCCALCALARPACGSSIRDEERSLSRAQKAPEAARRRPIQGVSMLRTIPLGPIIKQSNSGTIIKQSTSHLSHYPIPPGFGNQINQNPGIVPGNGTHWSQGFAAVEPCRSPSPSPPLLPPTRQRHLRCPYRVVALRMDVCTQSRRLASCVCACTWGASCALWMCPRDSVL